MCNVLNGVVAFIAWALLAKDAAQQSSCSDVRSFSGLMMPLTWGGHLHLQYMTACCEPVLEPRSMALLSRCDQCGGSALWPQSMPAG